MFCLLNTGHLFMVIWLVIELFYFLQIKLVVKYELQDQNSNDIVCILIPVEIEGSNSVKKLQHL